jgi:hypothetical protein
MANCPAGNALENKPSPYEVGIDFVPVTTDGSLGFHVVYSAKKQGSTQAIGNNSTISIFELDGGELLVFGAGYGDPIGPGTALNDAAFDVANVDAVVQQCLGRSPASTTVRFVAPHGHGDHVNPSFIHELENFGYLVQDIAYHEDDAGLVNGMSGWRTQDRSRFVAIRDGPKCTGELLSFSSPLGKIWFLSRPGHTSGSIDLVLDVRGNVEDRFVVLGSQKGGSCSTQPEGTRNTIEAHGNAIVPIVAQVVSYGCGANPTGSLSVLSGSPRIGTSSTVGIDDPLGRVAAGALPFLFVSAAPDPAIPCGSVLMLPGLAGSAELLISLTYVDLISVALPGSPWLGPGRPSSIGYSIPRDVALINVSLFGQGLLFDASGGIGARLAFTDALEFRIGP